MLLFLHNRVVPFTLLFYLPIIAFYSTYMFLYFNVCVQCSFLFSVYMCFWFLSIHRNLDLFALYTLQYTCICFMIYIYKQQLVSAILFYITRLGSVIMFQCLFVMFFFFFNCLFLNNSIMYIFLIQFFIFYFITVNI